MARNRKAVSKGIRMKPDADRKRELRERYNNRHPDKGIVCWKSKGRIWVMMSQDAKADFNGTSFQLNLGSWPNKEMQKAYNEDPNSFEWSLEKELEYEDNADDVTDDLKLMLMDYMEAHPDAKFMRPIKL